MGSRCIFKHFICINMLHNGSDSDNHLGFRGGTNFSLSAL